MKKVIAVLLLLIVVVTAALIFFTFGKPAPRAASLLPESTLAFLDIPDLSKSRMEFAKTEFYALWHEPEMQAFLAQPLAALREVSVSAGAPRDADTIGGLAFDAMQGEVFLAVTHVTIFPVFNPGLVLGVMFAPNASKRSRACTNLKASSRRPIRAGRIRPRNTSA